MAERNFYWTIIFGSGFPDLKRTLNKKAGQKMPGILL